MLKEINPGITYVPLRRRVRLRNLDDFRSFITRAKCVLLAIDSFVIADELARSIYRQTACVAGMELGGVEVTLEVERLLVDLQQRLLDVPLSEL